MKPSINGDGGFYCMSCTAAPFTSVDSLVAHKAVVHGASMPGFPKHQGDADASRTPIERRPCPRCGTFYAYTHLSRHLQVCTARSLRTG